MGKNNIFYWILFLAGIIVTGFLGFMDTKPDYKQECIYCHTTINTSKDDYVTNGKSLYWHADCYLKEDK